MLKCNDVIYDNTTGVLSYADECRNAFNILVDHHPAMNLDDCREREAKIADINQLEKDLEAIESGEDDDACDVLYSIMDLLSECCDENHDVTFHPDIPGLLMVERIWDDETIICECPR